MRGVVAELAHYLAHVFFRCDWGFATVASCEVLEFQTTCGVCCVACSVRASLAEQERKFLFASIRPPPGTRDTRPLRRRAAPRTAPAPARRTAAAAQADASSARRGRRARDVIGTLRHCQNESRIFKANFAWSLYLWNCCETCDAGKDNERICHCEIRP